MRFCVKVKRSYSLRRQDFQSAWDSGKAWTHPLIVLRARANASHSKRFGFVVGKKIGKAVQRNRQKRWMREAVRHRVDSIAPGWDLIFIARAREGVEFKALDAAIEQVLRRARLISSS